MATLSHPDDDLKLILLLSGARIAQPAQKTAFTSTPSRYSESTLIAVPLR